MKKKLTRRIIKNECNKYTGSFKYSIEFKSSDYWQSPLHSITRSSELTDTDIVLLVLKGLVHNRTIGIKDLLKFVSTIIQD